MASLQQRLQISARAGPKPASPPATTTPLPSIVDALAFVAPPEPLSSQHRHHQLQLPPLASIFGPQPQRQVHVIDGLYPPQAHPPPHHFGDGAVPQLRPRAVPSVIQLKNQANGTSSDHQHQQHQQPGQQPWPRRQQQPPRTPTAGLEWVDLTSNVEEEEEKHDKKLQLPPFTSSHRGHGTWCIRFGDGDGIVGRPLEQLVPPSAPMELSQAASSADGPSCPDVVLGTPKTTSAATADCGEVEKRCAHCGTRSTPEWRRGPTGRGTLCNACGLKYTKTLQQARRRKGQTGSTLGSVPLASLLNGPEDRKRRTSLSSPMVWQTKVKNFVSSTPSSSTSPSPSPSSLSASFPPRSPLFDACSLSTFSVSPSLSPSSGSGSPRKRARTQSLPNPPTHM